MCLGHQVYEEPIVRQALTSGLIPIEANGTATVLEYHLFYAPAKNCIYIKIMPDRDTLVLSSPLIVEFKIEDLVRASLSLDDLASSPSSPSP